MNILVVSDIHNDIENMAIYMDKVSLLDFDVIVCPGDFVDLPPRGFTSIDIAKLVLEELKTLKRPIVAVPGNLDKDVIKLLEEEGVSVHGRGKIINNIGFYGFGGAKTPFNTSYEPSEEETESGLTKGFEDVKNSKLKIQVTHIPPVRTRLDLIHTGAHVGSEAVRKFIEKNRPIVAISSHIHEAKGTDEIGETKLINSGRFPEGYCGLITIKNNQAKVKMVNLI